MQLHGKPLTMHLASSSAAAAKKPLVLYASGDGGWFGAAVDMFHSIARAGYPTVGLSSRSFMRLERPRDAPLNEARLAADYGAILDEARTDLNLQPDTPVILAGWSRGAAFAVIAATKMTTVTSGGSTGPIDSTEPIGAVESNKLIEGVVAIGLDEGEDFKLDADDDDDDPGQSDSSGQHKWPFETYPLLRSLDPLRVTVIQATHDGYLPAARARELFGPDTVSRRLVPIEARNHRFSGAREPFRSALVDALSWVAARN